MTLMGIKRATTVTGLAKTFGHSFATVGNVQIKRVSGSLGAEVQGLDVSRMSDADVEQVKQAWREHKVLFFRDQKLQPREFLEFSAHFGKPAP